MNEVEEMSHPLDQLAFYVIFAWQGELAKPK